MSGRRRDIYVRNVGVAPTMRVSWYVGPEGGMRMANVTVAHGGIWHLDLLGIADPNLRIKVTSGGDAKGIQWRTYNAYAPGDINLYVIVKSDRKLLDFGAKGYEPYDNL